MRSDWESLETLLESRTYADYTQHVQVEEESILLLSDVHLPYMDARLVQRALQTAQARQVEAVVWLGDLLDMPTYSPWGTDDPAASFEHELQVVEGLLRNVHALGFRQYWSSGNHEWRYQRKNDNQVSMERLAMQANVGDLMENGDLMVSDHPTLDYRDDWLLIHPAQYGTTPLKVPGQIADLAGKHVASAHAHHWGMGTSPSGKYTVVETGGAFQPSRIKYVNYRVGTLRPWVKGFVILDHGEPTLYR